MFSSLPGPRSSEFINDIPTYLFGISVVYDYRYDGNMSLCTVERCIIVIIIVNRGETAILIPTKIPRHWVWSRTRRRPMTISERSVTGKRASRWVRKIYTRDVDPHRRRLQCRGVYFIIYTRFFLCPTTCTTPALQWIAERYRPRENSRASSFLCGGRRYSNTNVHRGI